MAKKRKNTKGLNKSSSQDDSAKSEGRGSARSRKSQRPKNAHNPAANDDKLRNSVEGDGNLTIVDMNADGNCLFRAVSDQLFWDYGNNHDQVRADVCDFIAENEDDFVVFLVLDDDDADEEEDATDFESYVENMRQDGEWGGNLELVAAARIYRRKITVYSAMAAFTIDHGEKESDGRDMLVSFHDNDHYNSVRDKYRPSKPVAREIQKGGNKRNKASDSSGKTTKQKGKVVEDVEEAYTTDTTDSSGKTTRRRGHGKVVKAEEEASTMDATDSSGKTTRRKGKVVKAVEEASTMDTTNSSGKTTKRKGKGKVVQDVEEASTSDMTVSTTTSMSELTVKDGGETSNEPQKPVKKNSPCTCGSGQRYKKCCFAKKKHAARVQKLRGTEETEEEPFDENIHEISLKGNFRVLQI